MELNNINPIESQLETNLEINSQPISPKKIKTFPIVLAGGIIIGVILTASITSAVYFYQKSKTTITSNFTQNQPTITPTTAYEYSQFGSISWLDQPKQISAISIFNSEKINSEEYPYLDISSAEYFQVGVFSNGAQLINAYINPNDPGGTIIFRLIKDNNSIFLLTNMIGGRDLESVKEYLVSSLLFSDIKILELSPLENISLSTDNILYLFDSDSASSKRSSDFKNLQKIADSSYGSIYKNTFSIMDNISIDQVAGRTIYLKMKDGTLVSYKYKNEVSDDSIPRITWNSGTTNNDVYTQNISSGCGTQTFGSVPVILKDSTLLGDKIQVGKTQSGKSVFKIENKNNEFVKKLYAEYKQTRSYENTKIITLEEFVTNPNHFLLQDPTGDWQIFVNSNYSSLAECGKPVIYLYPTKETQIKVQVGAQITKSEPTYPNDGWVVIAKPNGELIYQNQTYSYLFWEGLGNGLYPDYKNKGIVVAQKDLISTLYSQLSQLGLNQKESADFMEFWQSKLPTTPFIRLTWLGTKDMDILAPLTVNPQPDTRIRIFLEFQGLQNPVKLIPQKLSAPAREGFTLIEWGGLLFKNN
ncbi:MAG: hypothetical protein PHP97_03195 [Candidatus Shapirobacteria bacterium]|nr:hypothetical protein [Candidatus Shapirobacteria bacterium]MDD4383022.1 hypothetical protein [Candidatus Shapirobacteria bacterium]